LNQPKHDIFFIPVRFWPYIIMAYAVFVAVNNFHPFI
jgi:hypothetical protein